MPTFQPGTFGAYITFFLYIVGRTKEIRSGFNVYPAEVEAVLSSHKDAVQSAVVGCAADGNEEIVGFVQLLPGSQVTPEDLLCDGCRCIALLLNQNNDHDRAPIIVRRK